jgi:predicted ATPase
MLSKITLENFFSFGKPTTIELNSGVNILVGINGSGKSNLLKAINLLYEGIAGEGLKKMLLQDWEGFGSVANYNAKESRYIKLTFEFNVESINKINQNKGFSFIDNLIYEITIFPIGNTDYYLKEKLYKFTPDGDDFIYIEMENGKGVISQRISNGKTRTSLVRYPQNVETIPFDTNELILKQISDPDRFYPQFTLKKAIENIAVYNYFDTTLNSEIRKPHNWSIENRLLPNGQNLTSLLQYLKNKSSLDYEQLEGKIKDINGNFKDIGFDSYANKIFLVLREKKLSKAVSIAHISDGTLRFILLLSIFFNKNRGNLISLDEPEIGLHPDMIFTVAKLIKNAASESQLIIATHSPLLLNDFDIEDLIIFDKNEDNQTVIIYKTEEDVEEWADRFTVGQLWMKGVIGGKRW